LSTLLLHEAVMTNEQTCAESYSMHKQKKQIQLQQKQQ